MSWEEVRMDLNFLRNVLKHIKHVFFLQDPGVQLGGIYNLYSIEVVDQQYFPTCFIDEALWFLPDCPILPIQVIPSLHSNNKNLNS